MPSPTASNRTALPTRPPLHAARTGETWMMNRLSIIAIVVVLAGAHLGAQASARHATCGSISGASRADLDRVREFCTNLITDAGFYTAARADGSYLSLSVNRDMALVMRDLRLDMEVNVKGMMRIWRLMTDSQVVRVLIEYEGVKIAEGRTTLLSGDVVDIP